MGDACPSPDIKGILSRLPKAEYTTGFWQVPLIANLEETPLLKILGPLVPIYRGAFNAPKTMSRLRDKVIPAEVRTHVFVCLDDLLIISGLFNGHLEVLRLVC